MRRSSKIVGIAILILGLVSVILWVATLQMGNRKLRVSFLDTGSGAATLIEAPGGRTVLIDGGPDAGILRSLGSALPWWQRSIDVVIAAHPDAAHVAGLIDVLQRYQVAQVFVSSAQGSGPVWTAFQKALTDAQREGTTVHVASRGNVINLGDGASIEVLFPDRDLSQAGSASGCIEMRLTFGTTSFMLSCGSEGIENYVARLDGTSLRSDALYSSGATSSPLFAGFVGAQLIAQPGEAYASDGKTILKEN
ncbi:MAG TPA: MBL fold metallo-hydrolase [Candidatus Paceibacterota bacterium]|nr:MBL fold metallo-hydrolase [Candidatus Paceibacterota bacterium]